jgi:hypothetical protein
MAAKTGDEEGKSRSKRITMFKPAKRNIYYLVIVFATAIFTLAGMVSCGPAVEPAPPPPENTAPVIHYITAPTETMLQTTSDIDCVATDADSDNLTYAWTCTGGTLLGSGASVVWNSPQQAGSYDLHVVVSDGKGGQAEQSATILVKEKANSAPVVSLTVKKEGADPVEVKPNDTTPVWVALWKTLVITCVAQDPDGDKVDLVWSASDGKLEGEGNTVTYIASKRGDFVVIVNAIDSKGASTKGVVYVHVPCCGEGSFGQKGT